MGLTEYINMLSFRHPVFPDIGWMFLMATGLFRMTGETFSQTVHIRVPESASCAPSGDHWKEIGETYFSAG